jgi:hypothetical protein
MKLSCIWYIWKGSTHQNRVSMVASKIILKVFKMAEWRIIESNIESQDVSFQQTAGSIKGSRRLWKHSTIIKQSSTKHKTWWQWHRTTNYVIFMTSRKFTKYQSTNAIHLLWSNKLNAEILKLLISIFGKVKWAVLTVVQKNPPTGIWLTNVSAVKPTCL